jgi:hypothetical protein
MDRVARSARAIGEVLFRVATAGIKNGKHGEQKEEWRVKRQMAINRQRNEDGRNGN